MDAAQIWREFFDHWPKEIPHAGVVVTNFDDQIPFIGYMTSESMLLLERRTPDTVGGRKVILPFANILAVKMTEVTKGKPYESFGFQGALPGG